MQAERMIPLWEQCIFVVFNEQKHHRKLPPISHANFMAITCGIIIRVAAAVHAPRSSSLIQLTLHQQHQKLKGMHLI
jgi:hypothetical protein